MGVNIAGNEFTARDIGGVLLENLWGAFFRGIAIYISVYILIIFNIPSLTYMLISFIVRECATLFLSDSAMQYYSELYLGYKQSVYEIVYQVADKYILYICYAIGYIYGVISDFGLAPENKFLSLLWQKLEDLM